MQFPTSTFESHARVRATPPAGSRLVMRCARCRYDLSVTIDAGLSACPECNEPTATARPSTAADESAAPLALIALGLAAPALTLMLLGLLAPIFAPLITAAAPVVSVPLLELTAALAATPACFCAATALVRRKGRVEAPSFDASAIGFAAVLLNGAAVTAAWFLWSAATL